MQEFKDEIAEGRRLYDGRISDDIKAQGDFFMEVIEKFIVDKSNES